MAKNNPVKICNIKQSPRRDPKFHMVVMDDGVGNSTTEPNTILAKGLRFLICFIYFKRVKLLNKPSII
jgi:hypothetical protein